MKLIIWGNFQIEGSPPQVLLEQRICKIRGLTILIRTLVSKLTLVVIWAETANYPVLRKCFFVS